MSVYGGPMAESVIASEFDGPQPSRYVPKNQDDDDERNRIAATPSLYHPEQQSIPRSGTAGGGPNLQQAFIAGPGPQPYSGPSNYANGPAINAARPPANNSFVSNMSQPQMRPAPPVVSNVSMMPSGGMGLNTGSVMSSGMSLTQGTIGPMNGGAPPPHGHHYAPSSGGGSSEGAASVYNLNQRAPPQAGAYYAPSSGTPSQVSVPVSHTYTAYNPAPPGPHGPPPQRAQASYSVSSYASPSNAPPSGYNAGPMAPPPQTMYGSGPSAYASHTGGRMPPGSTYEESTGSRVNKAGKIALGALAAGAVAYGVHEYVEQREEDEEKRRLAIAMARRQQEEAERVRRENEARRRREEEEEKRREEHERWRHEEDERHRQHAIYGQHAPSAYAPSVYAPSVYGRQRADSASSHGSQGSNHGGFRPPAPFGRPPYSYNPADVRFVDPSRSSENSATPETYPELRQTPNDTVIKIGTVLALKHVATSRLLRSDRSHSTASSSNQQLVYASRHNPAEDDWWQVLPANQDVPVPGSIVSYGTQIRLRHINTGRHLHSHYGFTEGMNEVTAYGDQTLSDENDHWVIERWGDGGYSNTWRSTEAVVLRHYVSGMALKSQKIMLREDVQSVTCHGRGDEDDDKWRVVLSD
ncbi:hypothetical protein IWW37_005725 [Coemansia sp. RSA 2050]|nr:hypothetical protein IWW37_005725 [Coemansia sp. RSA 2050]KAJ2729284.1 hypothetical protein IW152_005688 [Coemansia sp. BCRC 34962]